MPTFTMIDPTVEAVQVSAATVPSILAAYPAHVTQWQDDQGWLLRIKGREYRYGARNGDWIVRFSPTEFTVMTDAAFTATYEAV